MLGRNRRPSGRKRLRLGFIQQASHPFLSKLPRGSAVTCAVAGNVFVTRLGSSGEARAAQARPPQNIDVTVAALTYPIID